VLPLVISSQTVYAPVSTSYTATLPLVTSTQSVFAPTATRVGIQDVVLPLVTLTPVVYAPRVAGVLTLYTFEPPRDERGPNRLHPHYVAKRSRLKLANDLSARYGAPRSFSVLKIDGVYRQIHSPDGEQLAAATEVYLGGHIHEVDYATAVALEAAGFDVQGVG
jgi:hypothetical protein